MADKKISDGSLRDVDALTTADVMEVELPGTAVLFKTTLADLRKWNGSPLRGKAVADIAAPPVGEWALWVSNGAGAYGDGDVLITVTNSAGTTVTARLMDFSVLEAL